ncbi:hypothetical protein [Streptomyces sp. NPDC014734]|uniref:DUF6197 family protein n=1 Tax=Streptomyces sp. NPDC014734 TaxID=3364886 RepID=UPI0036F574AA
MPSPTPTPAPIPVRHRATIPLPTPDQLDAQAARLHDTEVWYRIVSGWDLTAVEPVRPIPFPVSTDPSPDRRPEGWRDLLSVPVDQLIADSVRALPTAAPRERPLPGRLGAMLPDRLHTWRRIGQPDIRPSTHLAHARRVLTEWGWQNTPYRLRNARGARCVCGALLTAHRLGYGSLDTVDRAGAWIVTELRSRGWTGLIGPWNRCPGRTAEEALALIDATIDRAALAGQ